MGTVVVPYTVVVCTFVWVVVAVTVAVINCCEMSYSKSDMFRDGQCTDLV